MMLTLQLPFPPSINHYHRHFRGKTVISREGRAFRNKVCSILGAMHLRTFSGKLAVVLNAYPPDRRRRDVDNLQKPVLDALEKANVYENDSQIKNLHTIMHEPLPGGKLIVEIKRIG